MSIVWSIVWGIMTPLVMVLTMKHYLPVLASRVPGLHSEAPKITEENEKGTETSSILLRASYPQYTMSNWMLRSSVYRMTLLLCATVFAAICGYSVGTNATSTLGLFRITVTFAVLSCTFVTDLELFLIPNLCSLVLIAVRICLIALEFILKSETAALGVMDSIVALAISLTVLLIIAFITRGGIGAGDIKLFSSIGFICGIRAVCFTLTIAFLLCALCSTGLLLMKKKELQDTLPLGPFVLCGFGLSVILALI